ncbi:FMN-binding negative transcriptional regulator [Niveibacterium sp. SC-1]|uniref:FMN-binding negative transcriptional regulator n=1 Tax=Niveibacterium sp. SC-1 TaxID=3135646 RepID=UPI0031204657
MSLYIPPHFEAPDADAIIGLIHAYPFATLVSVVEGEPLITHLPLVADENGLLLGHVAHANPQAAALKDGATVTAIFHGPHAYVSPTWYAKPNVPTWNYATVHVKATVRPLEEPEIVQALLDGLIATFDDEEAAGETPHMTHEAREELFGHIHCFALEIEDIEAKFKLSQNRSAADQKRVVAALGQREDDNARELVGLMLQGLRQAASKK